MAELEATVGTPPTGKPSGRGWFIATSIVAIVGVALAAWFSLRPATRDTAPPAEMTATAPAPSPIPPAVKSVNEPPAQTRTQDGNLDVTQPPEYADTTAAPAPASNATPAEKEPSRPDATATVVTVDAPTPQDAASASAPTPVKTIDAAPPPVTKATAPPAAPKKKAPEKVVKAAPAPAKKSPKAPPVSTKTTPKKTTSKKAARPRTREEKVAALLISGGENLRADRLTKPKERNALSDYLTALAIDKHNEAAHRGVEQIVQRYVAKARQATGSRQFDNASSFLHQARYVLDAMKLRKWPQVTFDTLFADFREASQVLAAAR